MALICPYCGTPARLTDSREIYKNRSYGPAWVCGQYPVCDAYVGCHPGTRKALGRLADKELRQAKVRAHDAFDRLWRAKIRQGLSKKEARRGGYKWLARQLGIPAESCHIGWFDVAMCDRVVEVCAPFHDTKRCA